ncbi:MAG: SIS domain-containing protein [Patescibacteria group bacterium]|nr:SIS domain-containing protein [Patescibacteria group bacterium]
MEETILNFAEQFKWEPEINNSESLGGRTSKWIVCGMGGSHLAAGLMRVHNPRLDLLIHRDYGLPRVPDYFLEGSLIILSSYSGNTEEILDAGKVALERGLNLAVISTDGALLEFAEANQLPYVQSPSSDKLQPRMALGYSLKAMAKLIGNDDISVQLSALADTLEPAELRPAGEKLAEQIKGKIPLFYSSVANLPLAYNWKIKFNETAKAPAFYNVLPEANHNEMAGFNGVLAQQDLNQKFFTLFLTDPNDELRLAKRFQVLAEMYRDWGVSTEEVPLSGGTSWQRIFNSLVLADWAAYHLATLNGDDPEAVPMIEEFKKLIG